MSIKNSSDIIGNRTRDLPVCSTVSQPTTPPRAPNSFDLKKKSRKRTLRSGSGVPRGVFGGVQTQPSPPPPEIAKF
jgi:hypothetical protein